MKGIFLAVGNHSLPTDVLKGCTDGFFYCFSEWANTVTAGAFWIFALITFCVAIFMATARFGSTRAFGFASFVSLIGGVWLAILGFIAWWVASAFVVVGVIGISMMILSEK